MSLIECPECHAKVSSAADVCIKCGFPIKTLPPPPRITFTSAQAKAIKLIRTSSGGPGSIASVTGLTIKQVNELCNAQIAGKLPDVIEVEDIQLPQIDPPKPIASNIQCTDGSTPETEVRSPSSECVDAGLNQQTPNEEPSEQPKKATPKTIGKRTSYASRVAPPNRALAILGRIGGAVGMLALMAGIIAFFVFMFSDRPEKPSGIPAAPKNATNTKLPGYLCGSWAEIGYLFTGDDSITPDFKEIGSASPSSIRLIVNLSSRRQNSMNDELIVSKVHGGESGSGVDVVIQFSNSAFSMQVSSLPNALKNPEKYPGKYALRLYDNNTGKEVSRWLLSVTPSQTSKLYYPDNRLPGDSEGVYDAGLNKWVVKRNGKTVFLDAWQP